jgi:hypothetical protein
MMLYAPSVCKKSTVPTVVPVPATVVHVCIVLCVESTVYVGRLWPTRR